VIHRLRAVAGEQLFLVMLLGIPALLRHPVWRRVDAGQGAGLGVLLIPGFGFGDRSLALTGAWLRARGYRPAGARIGLNVGCTSTLVTRVERRLEEHAQATGRRVVMLGQSRGGWLGRLVAIRRPDLVRALVMLASPVLDPLGVNPNSVRYARRLARLSALGVPDLVDEECFSGECYRTTVDGLAEPLPAEVPALAVYSRRDRTVPWRLCLDRWAECVELRSSHTGMGLDPNLYATLEPRLAKWALDDAVIHNSPRPAAASGM
jgi:pimeloyl-ACP methyl ester carboxylesterase